MLTVDRELSTAESALRALATSPAFATADLAAIHRQIKTLLASFPGADIIVADKAGQQLVNSFRALGEPLPKRNNSDVVRLIFEDGKPIVSGLFPGAITHRALIGVDVPVMNDGRVVYDLSMTFPAERFGALLSQHHFPGEWVGVIIDQNGVIVARTRNPEKFVGQPGGPILRQNIALAAEGMLEDVTLDGTLVESAFSRSPMSGWSVAIGVPKAVLLEDLHRWLWWELGGAIVSSLVGFIVAGLIGRRIVRSNLDLAESEARFKRLVENCPLSIGLVGTDGRIVYVNQKFVEVFGYHPQDVPTVDHWYRLAYPDEAYRAEVVSAWMSYLDKARAERSEIEAQEYHVTCNNGEIKTVSILGVWIGDQVLAIFDDITERKRLEQTLQDMARTDPLTGLVNRRTATEAFEAEFLRSKRYGTDASLFMIDIDHFKPINDTYGHIAGDQALVALATVLKTMARATDLPTRFGGTCQ